MQIYLIAEETAPSFVTVTLPRLLAGAVKTPRVTDALIAQLPLPPQFASNLHKIHIISRRQYKVDHPLNYANELPSSSSSSPLPRFIINPFRNAVQLDSIQRNCDLQALVGVVAEPVLVVTSGQADCCKINKQTNSIMQISKVS